MTTLSGAGTKVVRSSRDPVYVQVRMDSPMTWLGSADEREQVKRSLVRRIGETADRNPQRIITLRVPDDQLQFERLPGSVRAAIIERSGDVAPKNWYERRMASLLREALEKAREERPPLLLSVLGLPVEGDGEDAAATNRNYSEVIDSMEAVVSPRSLLIRGGDAGALARNAFPRAFELANGRPVLFKTNNGWRVAAERGGPHLQKGGSALLVNPEADVAVVAPLAPHGGSPVQQLLASWGQTESPWDLNSDGVVDVDDLMLLIANWGQYAQNQGQSGSQQSGGGPMAQWASTPPAYIIGSGVNMRLTMLASAPENVHVLFQTWSDTTESIEAVHQDNSPPFRYPASVLDTVTPGGAEVQALVRNEQCEVLAIIRHNMPFVAPEPEPPSGGGSSGGGSSGGGSSGGGSSGGGSNGGGAGGGGAIGANPGADPNAPPPTPTITLLSASGQAPFTIHVHALSSQLGVGTPMTARYEWDFGDGDSAFNTLVGFNAAHVYENPGTYTITLRIINQAGRPATTTASVTVQPSTRTVYYVADNGNDSNPGTSPNAPIRTVARVNQLMGNNKEFLFRRAATYDVSSTLNIGANNVVIGAYGSGARPALRWIAGGSFVHLLKTLPSANNVVIRDVELTSNITSVLNNTIVQAMQVRGTNITVKQCHFSRVSYAMNGEAGGANGWFSVGNTAAVLGAYYAWCEGQNIAHVGNTVAGSVDEHNIRTGGAQRVLIAHNDLTNESKSTVWLMLADYASVMHNTLRRGRFIAGPNFAFSSDTERARWIVFEGNEMVQEGVILYSGAENVMLRNNLIRFDGGDAFSVWGYLDDYHRTTRDVGILNNTVINNASLYGRFAKIGEDAHNVMVANNMYCAPNLNTQSGGANVRADDADMNTYAFRNNLWATPDVGQSRHFKNGAGQSVNQWASNSQCSNEHYRAFSGSDVQGAMQPMFDVNFGEAFAGVLVDRNGILRPVTGSVSVGAVEISQP